MLKVTFAETSISTTFRALSPRLLQTPLSASHAPPTPGYSTCKEILAAPAVHT